MNIIISFAKLSAEFSKVGFNNPLFDMKLDQKREISLLQKYMEQFEEQFETSKFYLLFEKGSVEASQIRNVLYNIGISNYEVLEISSQTKNSKIADVINQYQKPDDKFLLTYFGPVFMDQIQDDTTGMLLDTRDNFIAVIQENRKLKELLGQIDFYNIKFLNKNGFERLNVPVTHNLNQYSKIVELYPDVANQADRMIDEIYKLIYDMRFDEAETEFKKHLKIDQILAEYLIYLDRTAQIEILEIDLKKYKVKEMLQKNSNLKHKKRLEELVKKQEKIAPKNIHNKMLNVYSFEKEEDQELFELIRKNPLEAKAFIHANKTKYMGAEIKDKDKEQLVSFYIQTIIKARQFKHDDVMLVVAELTPTVYTLKGKYWPENVKRLFVKMYEYMRFYDPLYFQLKHHEGDGSVTQRNYYNHLQPLLSILATLDNDKFKPGAKRYFEMIARGSDITFLEKSTSPIKLLSKTNVKVETPKTAVCVSGMMRSDFEFYLTGLKENVIDPLNADVYMFTWDKYEKYSGIGNFITLPNAIWTERFFPKGTPILPEEIKTVEKFKNELPNTFDVIAKPIYESVDVDAIKKVVPNAKIIIEKEKDFDSKYVEQDFYRRGSRNQAKMFYGINKAFTLASESDKYDFVFKSRFDFRPNFKYSYDLINQLGERELGMMHHRLVGPMDLFYYGRYDEMRDLNNIWRLAEEQNHLSKFYVQQKEAHFDAHKLFLTWMFENNLFPAPQHVNNHIFIRDNGFNLPSIDKELKKDLAKMNKKKAEKYSKFFTDFYALYK